MGKSKLIQVGAKTLEFGNIDPNNKKAVTHLLYNQAIGTYVVMIWKKEEYSAVICSKCRCERHILRGVPFTEQELGQLLNKNHFTITCKYCHTRIFFTETDIVHIVYTYKTNLNEAIAEFAEDDEKKKDESG